MIIPLVSIYIAPPLPLTLFPMNSLLIIFEFAPEVYNAAPLSSAQLDMNLLLDIMLLGPADPIPAPHVFTELSVNTLLEMVVCQDCSLQYIAPPLWLFETHFSNLLFVMVPFAADQSIAPPLLSAMFEVKLQSVTVPDSPPQ